MQSYIENWKTILQGTLGEENFLSLKDISQTNDENKTFIIKTLDSQTLIGKIIASVQNVAGITTNENLEDILHDLSVSLAVENVIGSFTSRKALSYYSKINSPFLSDTLLLKGIEGEIIRPNRVTKFQWNVFLDEMYILYDYFKGTKNPYSFAIKVSKERLGSIFPNEVIERYKQRQISLESQGEGDELKGTKYYLLRDLERVGTPLTLELREIIINIWTTDIIPKEYSLVHNGLKLDNIILGADGLVPIDWSRAYIGNIQVDLSRLILSSYILGGSEMGKITKDKAKEIVSSIDRNLDGEQGIAMEIYSFIISAARMRGLYDWMDIWQGLYKAEKYGISLDGAIGLYIKK